MNQIVRSLKLVAASRHRARKRLEAEMLRLRRKMHDAQSDYVNKCDAVERCREDEVKLHSRIAELMEAEFSISARMAMGHLNEVLAGKTAGAVTAASASKKRLEAERLALAEMAQQLARNRQQVDVVETKVVELIQQEAQEAEDAESDETEEGAAAGLAMRLRSRAASV
jgi:Bacterial type III secretion protein (HrpB7)